MHGGMGSMSFDDRPAGRSSTAGASRGGGFSGIGSTGGTGLAVSPARSTAAQNFYKQAQQDGGHRVARKTAKAAGGMPKRPNFLMCYLCGQQFGKASLPIHQPQCFVKKLVEWERNDPDMRGPKPLSPEEQAARAPQVDTRGMNREQQAEAFNDAQYQQFSDNMLACENCGRTFFPDRLVIHKRSCHPAASGRGSKPVAGKNTAGSSDAATLPPHSTDRHRAASPPIRTAGNGLRKSTSMSPRPAYVDAEDPDAPNDEAYAETLAQEELAALDQPQQQQQQQRPKRVIQPPPAAQLEPCPSCNRRFVPKKLEAHIALCKGPSPLGANGAVNYEKSLVPCQHCSRTFAPDRIGKHEEICSSSKNGPASNPRRPQSARPAPAVSSPPPVATSPSLSSGKPKFCQECGNRFNNVVPKFCQECGTRV